MAFFALVVILVLLIKTKLNWWTPLVIVWILYFGMIMSWVGAPMSMALNLMQVDAQNKKANAYVLEAELSIKEIPFIWRCMFYRALTQTPLADMMLKMDAAGERPDAANTQLETGEPRV